MLEFIEKMNFGEDSIFILIQATSPFTRPEDIDKAIKKSQRVLLYYLYVISIGLFGIKWTY